MVDTIADIRFLFHQLFQLNNLTIPVLSANLESTEPAVNETVKPYHVYPEYNVARTYCYLACSIRK